MAVQQTSFATTLHFSPLLDQGWLWIAIALGGLLFTLSVFTYRRALVFRFVVFASFILALMNPSLLQEERNYVQDVAVIVVDRSNSQNTEKRTERTERALVHLQKAIQDANAFELRVIEAPKDGTFSSRTDLFTSLDQALVDVPIKRRAGVIFLSDGQIHDIPKNENLYDSYGPVHALLSGKKGEKDRQIVVTHAPAYGLVGKDVTLKYEVKDTRNIGKLNATVTVQYHDGSEQQIRVPVNREQSLALPLKHPSKNIFSLSVESVDDEITKANNKAAVIVNGVRDRLKVLLVSGIPHSGERTWRDLLTSDPGVDLVHFTILREPRKFDYTPKNELSLIAFPFRELFEVKLYDFDLIIFDRYRVNNILPERYFRNIARYVREGGAFLEASGPAFSGSRSIYDTPLRDILPAKPTGQVLEQRYTPSISKLGHSHPVTRSLVWKNQVVTPTDTEHWGSWLRYIDIIPHRGDTLMHSLHEKPLLVLDRVDQGRVAQLSSDHIWLWSRGYDGGGPHAELLRRIVHWLMKEPELDEQALDVRVHKNTITVEKQSYGKRSETLAMNTPNGDTELVELTLSQNGLLRYTHEAQNLGIYAFEDTNGTRKFALVGDIDPPELRGVITTDEHLSPLVKASSGTTIWLQDTARPRVSAIQNARRFGGSDWLALKRNRDYSVTSVRDISLFPSWALLLGLLTLMVLLWWREGQVR